MICDNCDKYDKSELCVIIHEAHELIDHMAGEIKKRDKFMENLINLLREKDE